MINNNLSLWQPSSTFPLSNFSCHLPVKSDMNWIRNERKIYSVFSETAEKNKNNDPENCRSRLVQAKKIFLSCPEAKNLWNEVKKDGSFTIGCFSMNHPAWVTQTDRKISLSNTLSVDEMVQNMLFELNNLKRSKQFLSLKICEMEMNEFAIAGERIEYESVKDTYKISSECAKSGDWSQTHVMFKKNFENPLPEDDWNNFENGLKTQEKLGHTEVYRSDWKEQCDPEIWHQKSKPKLDKLLKATNELVEAVSGEYKYSLSSQDRNFFIKKLNELQDFEKKKPFVIESLKAMINKMKSTLQKITIKSDLGS